MDECYALTELEHVCMKKTPLSEKQVVFTHETTLPS